MLGESEVRKEVAEVNKQDIRIVFLRPRFLHEWIKSLKKRTERKMKLEIILQNLPNIKSELPKSEPMKNKEAGTPALNLCPQIKSHSAIVEVLLPPTHCQALLLIPHIL